MHINCMQSYTASLVIAYAEYKKILVVTAIVTSQPPPAVSLQLIFCV